MWILLVAALFTDDTDQLLTQPCGPGPSTGCYSNYVVMADLDGDADLDVVFASGGGYYVAGTAAPMAVYLNDGAGVMTDVTASAFGGFTGRLRQVAVADVDADGDLDVLAPDSWAMQPDALFINDGLDPPGFTDQGAARLGTSSRSAGARFGDLDDDGDLDLVLTDWGTNPPGSAGTAHVYFNDGTGTFAELAGAVPSDTSGVGTGPIDVDLADVDGDFDLDLLLASREGESLLFLNGGLGVFTDANSQLPDQPGPYVYGPDPCDIDGDGDLDLWLDNGAAMLREQLLVNDGAGVFTDETAARVAGNPGADDNEVQCADLDGDGDLDAVIASLSNNERVLRNDGAGQFAAWGGTGTFPAVGDATLGLDLGDLNGDGRLDAVTAQGEITPYLNRLYLGTAELPADAQAPRFRAVEQIADGTAGQVAIRFAVVDEATTDVGPRLSAVTIERIGAGAAVPAVFVGGDLFRAVLDVPAQTTIEYRACATDVAGNQACSATLTFVSGVPGTPDAGVPGGPDAATPGGPDAGTPVGGDGGGCGCTVGASSSGGPALVLLLLFLFLFLFVLVSRRRRRID